MGQNEANRDQRNWDRSENLWYNLYASFLGSTGALLFRILGNALFYPKVSHSEAIQYAILYCTRTLLFYDM
jgi:hypothetical protein